MRQSATFTKLRREPPQDEVAKNAKLLTRAGFIHKEMAGVYSYLPLGLKTLENIAKIVRKEMIKLGAEEVLLSSLQSPETWLPSGRWSDEAVDFWFKTKLKNQTEIGLGATHEEPLTRLLTDHLRSYRDLPLAIYQVATKFRNETRAKNGLLRTREFLMKDLYSFHAEEAELDDFYEKVKESYFNIFREAGLSSRCYLTIAAGGTFSNFSHEFQVLSEAGEDTIYLAEKEELGINIEVGTEELLKERGINKEDLVARRAIEVGNIFKLGTKFSEAAGLNYRAANGELKPTLMASYGLGLSRLMGTVAEVLSDDRGLVWPVAIAPFRVHLIRWPAKDQEVAKTAEEIYFSLLKSGIEILYDDRDLSIGEHLAESDLLGLPQRLIVTPKNLSTGKVEVVRRQTGEVSFADPEDVVKIINA